MSSTIDMVVTTDNHMQASAWTGRQIVGDAEHALEQAVDYAVRRKAKAVLQLGDANDRQSVRSYVVGVWVRQLRKLEAAGIPFLYIRGNHDFDDPPFFAAFPNTVHLHNKVVDVGNRKVTGLDSTPCAEMPAAMAAMPYADVACFHQMWHDNSPYPMDHEPKLVDLPPYPLVLSGDLHQTLIKDVSRPDGSVTRFVSPGSMSMQAINEPVEKYFFTVDSDGKLGRVRIRSRPVVCLPEVHTTGEVDAMIAGLPLAAATAAAGAKDLPEHLRQPLVRIFHAPGLGHVESRAKRAVGNAAHIFVSELAVRGDEESAEIVRGRTSLALSLPHVLSAKDHPDTYRLVSTLLDSPGPAKDIDAFCLTFLDAEQPCT